MVYKCAASDCKSGYSSEEKKLNVTYHSFPLKNEELLCNWLKNIARKNFKPSKYSKLCSLHFKADDFIKVSHDSKQRRKRKRDSEHLCYRRLKPGAVPYIFKNIPLYYTSVSQPFFPCGTLKIYPMSHGTLALKNNKYHSFSSYFHRSSRGKYSIIFE